MWNSKRRITKREYLKYNNPEAFDLQGKHIKPGDTVVINNNYYSTPRIGVVDHYTEAGNLAIIYTWYSRYGSRISGKSKSWAYRSPCDVVKLKSGRKKK